ncbi:MAG: hypothetical protein HN855_14775 [Anaerolineae bacterium]|jgi:hypothetical protein|nr:hypothetical protein [Anaerolineae bacterium]MBT7071625.1 hypothetical protein [Anaerolineae bacterium]MBT7326420.1 hypothetical protein [Anaerolineae bacterium]
MKNTKALFLALIFIFLSVITANAQASESIWLEADAAAYKTEEIVTVRLNGASSTPIQGFTFQIRYDPNCLKPINASSPVAGMNGLQLPQNIGLVDATFASTTPQAALGVLAEVSFQALGGCQTELYLESAALAVRDASGFAVPLSGIALGKRNIPLSIDKTVGNIQEPALLGTPLSLEPTVSANSQSPDWAAAIAISLLFFVGMAVVAVIFVVYKRSYSS